MEIIKKYIGTELKLSKFQKYSFTIGIILLLIVIYCQYKWECVKCQNTFEQFQNRIKNNTGANFHTLIANLLDSQQLSDKISLEIQLDDMETLLKYNNDYKELNREPILSSYQERLVNDFIKYRDFYHIDKAQNDIVTLVRNNIDESPLKDLDNNQKILALNLLRRNIYYFHPHYFKKQEIKDKILWMQNKLGLKKIKDIVSSIKTIFSSKHWFGIKDIQDTKTLPNKITVYHPEEDKFYHKMSNSKWIKYKLKTDGAVLNNSKDIDTIQKIGELTEMDKYRIINKHLHLWYNGEGLEEYSVDINTINNSTNANITSEFYTDFEMINSVTIPTGGYMFVDYPTEETYENLTKTLVRIAAKDSSIVGDGVDVRTIGFWLQNKELNNAEKKYFVKSLIISYHYANFENFMDLLTIMSFFDVTDVSTIIDLFPDKNIIYFNNYWTYQDWNKIQRNSLKMGQCSISGEFAIAKISNNWRFNYNGTDYYNYWSAVEAYITDLINSITFGLKTNDHEIVASVAEFCYINNASFVDYLHQGSKCEEDTCNDVEISRLFEPDRCQHLKDKYRQLHLKISNKKCADLTNFSQSKPVIKDIMMFNIMRLALKIRDCQIDFELPEQECVDNQLDWDIDTNEQPNDKDLTKIQTDDKNINAQSSPYDKQLARYKRLMAQQEKQQLAGLNNLANQAIKTKTIDDMTLQEFGHYIGRGVLNMVDDVQNPHKQESHQYTNTINTTGLINSNDPFLTNTTTTQTNSENFTPIIPTNNNNDIIEGFSGQRVWETGVDRITEKLYTGNKKNTIQINEETRTQSNKEQFTKDLKTIEKMYEDTDRTEFERVNNVVNGTTNIMGYDVSNEKMEGITGSLMMIVTYLRNIIEAITREDRMMFTGIIFIFIAISLYFIDITS